MQPEGDACGLKEEENGQGRGHGNGREKYQENKNPGWGDLAGMANHDDMVAVIAALLKALREAENSRK